MKLLSPKRRFVVLLLMSSCTQVSGKNISLDDAVQQALFSHPRLQAMDELARAHQQLPSQKATLPDPMVAINALSLPVDTFDLDQEAMTQLQVSVSQQFLWPGKRRLKEQAAVHLAASTGEQREELASNLRREVRVAWWQLLGTEKALEIVGQTRNLLRDGVEIARSRYAVGKGAQQDVLLAQLELSRLNEREAVLEGLRGSQSARLAGVVGRPGDAFSVSEDGADMALHELPSAGDLVTRAVDSRHLIGARQRHLEAAESELELARFQHKPDFRLGLGYGIRQGRPDFASVLFSMNLPIYTERKQRPLVVQKQAERAHRELLRDDALRQMAMDIHQHHAGYSAARVQLGLLTTQVIPQARQTVDSMMAGYQVGNVDFSNLVNGELMLLNAQINYWQTVSAAKQSLARLSEAVGEESVYE